MNNNLLPQTTILYDKTIESCIFNIKGQQVMLDSDIAKFFEVEVKRINEQMKRNKNRFPQDFCFQLIDDELNSILRPQNATSNKISSKRRYNPYVYTEEGIITLDIRKEIQKITR